MYDVWPIEQSQFVEMQASEEDSSWLKLLDFLANMAILILSSSMDFECCNVWHLFLATSLDSVLRIWELDVIWDENSTHKTKRAIDIESKSIVSKYLKQN
jgi:hypothetical protein